MPQSSSFSLGESRARRSPGLTPMIDVVFLILVFFMLTARFGADFALPLQSAVPGGTEYHGAPRLVSVGPEKLALNGIETAPGALVGDLKALAPDPGAMIVVRPVDEATLQDLVRTVDLLRAGGFERIVIAE